MCGIAGFFDRGSHDQNVTIRKMLYAQAHRGPDAEGIFSTAMSDRQVILGHRRLSIIDTSDKANQPMTYEHLTIVFNGEVYNFAEIRLQLIQRGYLFDTNSDTEVILKAFHCFGIRSLDLFRGMFAFCMLDQKDRKAYLVRDRVGVKPLYYYAGDTIFVFSSEICALKYHPDVRLSISKHGMPLFFQYGYIPSPWSIFDNTFKVQPGHYLEYDIAKHSFQEKKYWDLTNFYQLPKMNLPEDEIALTLRSLLTESFSLRMIADVPIGVLLSGGVDSSLIAAIIQANTSRSINTFTVNFHDQDYDESLFARQIAKHLGTQHYETQCNWQDAAEIITQLPSMYGEPIADDSAIPTALIAKFARQEVTVVLSGDGGDELFCGYQAYPLNARRFKQIHKLPFKNTVSKLLNYLPVFTQGYALNYDAYSRFLKFKSVLESAHIEDNYAAIIRTYTKDDMLKLFTQPSRKNSIINSPQPILEPLERMMLFDFKQYLPDDLLVKVDRATMYYSLEGREPLLDHKLLEFVAQLPMRFKFQKNILKQVLKSYVPEVYFERKKHGFGMPINRWLRRELSYLVEQYLDPVKCKQQGIFNHEYVQGLKKAFKNSKTNDSRIWTLLVFQMWYEKYFNESF